MEPVESKICSLEIEEAKCVLKPCRTCGFSFPEMERRRKLPLVKLDNGLYGKRVGGPKQEA